MKKMNKFVPQRKTFSEHYGSFEAWSVTRFYKVQPLEFLRLNLVESSLDSSKLSTKKILPLGKIILFLKKIFFGGHRRVSLNSGQAMLTMVVFFMFLSAAIVFGVISPILKQISIAKQLLFSTQSYYLSESGLE